MEIHFDKEYLSELYYTGRCSDKKHRYQPPIIRKYIRVLTLMAAVSRIEELMRLNGLNYEVLRGNKSGIESVRVNDQYRIEFQSRIVEGETILTICNILELSNHYK